jgi:adenylate cyclase
VRIQLSEGPTAEDVKLELAQILMSDSFRGSERLKQFLRFLVEEALQGRGGLLKEYVIGVEVFGRGESFDPRRDTIVRTEARKLRSRLAAYYATGGQRDAIRIEFSPGTYTPTFRVNDSDRQFPLRSEFAQSPDGHQSTARWLVTMESAGSRSGVARPADNRENSIVVLPFADLSEERDGGIFSDGLTDELIDSLGRVPGLQVVARTSAFQFRGKAMDVREIGQMLNVRHVLEGSVRRFGRRLRITVELDDTQSGFQIWSNSYDREVKDILAIQSEISKKIVSALGFGLKQLSSVPAATGTDLTPPTNPDSYQDYVRGRYFLNKHTPESIRAAIGYFELAVSTDSRFAPACAGLAECYAIQPVLTNTNGLEMSPKIKATALRALALDNHLSDAHRALALAYDYEFNWDAARTEYETAVNLGPGKAEAHASYAIFLARMGLTESAVLEMRKGFELDQVSPDAATVLGRGLCWLRRYDDAEAQFRTALRLDHAFGMAHQGLGITYVHKKMYEEGIAELTIARRALESGPFSNAELGYAYAVLGKRVEAETVLAELLEQSKSGAVPAVAFALIYIGLGDPDRAFAALNTAVDQHDVNLLLKADPVYDPLRVDSRFGQLLERMKLTDVVGANN